MGVSFRPLQTVPGVRAAFFGRIPHVPVDDERATVLARLAPFHQEWMRTAGFDPTQLTTAEQVHGDAISKADHPGFYAGADALITATPGLVLGIYVADCAAVYLADRHQRAIGLIHSGRAGTAFNIVGKTLAKLQEEFGVPPEDVVVQLSPCIRPPLYETDFAAAIVQQARAAGVADVRDEGICTGRAVDAYYSYRIEKGRTGRMLAVLSLSS